jgi:hypothetical protein
VLHLGDLAYNLESKNGRQGDMFGYMKEDISSRMPYMTIPGNHENYQNTTHYKARYNMPVNYANNSTDAFYSFNLGTAHFVMFDTERYLKKVYDKGAIKT